MTDSTKGYKHFVRGDGSDWYLCDYCEEIAFVTSSEEEMKLHVRRKHT